MTKINQKIIGYKVKTGQEQEQEQGQTTAVTAPTPNPVAQALTSASRPDVLSGRTIKVKVPDAEALNGTVTMYVTVNCLPDGTIWEVFINSKNVRHFQWIQALTVTLSAARGNVTALLQELTTVHDPIGGFWFKGRHRPSLVALIAQEILALGEDGGSVPASNEPIATPVQAKLTPFSPCPKCGEKSLKRDGGCEECTSCGYSKCS